LAYCSHAASPFRWETNHNTPGQKPARQSPVEVTDDHWLPFPIVGHLEVEPRFLTVTALRVSAVAQAVATACCKSAWAATECDATIPKTSDLAGMGRNANMDSNGFPSR
jgi:hypothetical protein